MRSLHLLRVLRRHERVRNLDPLSFLTLVQKAGDVADSVEKLRRAPEQLNQLGQAAQTVTDSKLAERVGKTAEELSETARWIKYAAIGGVGIAGFFVLQRAISRQQS